MIELLRPDIRFYPSFRESHQEWNGEWQHGAGIPPGKDLFQFPVFVDWVAYLLNLEQGINVPENLVPCTFRWIVEDDTYIGSIALRHRLNPWLEQFGGHIGYGIRPSYRGLGIAPIALRKTLPLARELGLSRVLLTCVADNMPSQKVILGAQGVLENTTVNPDGEALQRYWIDLSEPVVSEQSTH